MKRVAVTGAAGYLGGLLTKRLASEPYVEFIVGYDIRPIREGGLENFTFCRMDVCDSALADHMKQHGVNALIHCAFVLFPQPGRLVQMERVNVNGAANVLKAAAYAGVQTLVAISSTTVYGAWPDNPVPLTEEHPIRPNPDYHYAVHKERMEALWRDFAQEHPQTAWVILRPPGILGPHAHGPLVKLWRGPITFVVDGGYAPGQFVHEDDLVELIVRALKAETRGIFNATPDDWMPWREIWRGAGKRLVNLPWPVARRLFGAMWRMGLLGGVTHPAQVNLARFPFVATNHKAKRELGWQPRYTTLQTVQSFASKG